jgi:hypothetical protein
MTALRSDERAPLSPRRRRLWGLLRAAAIATSVIIGLSMIMIAMVVGSCDAFGGSCPAERPPLLEDDVFGMTAFGSALVVAVPLFLSRPSRQRLLVAVAVGLPVALFVGLVVSSSAAQG